MPLPRNKTKIVATIGPASESRHTLQRLIRAGVNVARLNFSHGDLASHAERIQHIRSAAETVGRRVAIMADLPGPKMRIGTIEPEPIQLQPGEHFTLTTDEITGNLHRVSVSFKDLPSVVKPGDRLFLNDGLVELTVAEVSGGDVHCIVSVAGELRSKKGLILPGIALGISAFTDHDRACLEFALRHGVDAVSQSFVETPADIQAVRAAANTAGKRPFIVAKIERLEAIRRFDDILNASDGIMVARGDLGVEVPIEEMAVLQKRLIARAHVAGKPVITATQMLESMVQSPEPTRAEASDIANAILDGTSAIMLSGETAVGSYPVEAVAVMDRIALAVEPHLGYRHETPQASDEPTIDQAMSNAACDVAEAIAAKAILVPTFTGRTASAVARLRPQRAILALTHNMDSLRHLALEWGVTPLEITETTDVEDLWTRSISAARDSGIVLPGERLVITAGTAVNIPGGTNVIKVDAA